MSGHNRASQLGQEQKAVNFDGRFLQFTNGAPTNGTSGFGKGAIGIDSANGRIYMNTGTESSATWSEVAGSSYMDDRQGVAPMMYGQKANILILGDSMHNPNTDYKNDDTGLYPLTAAYNRAWQPNKWAGVGVALTTGSHATGYKNKATGTTNVQNVAKKPGQLVESVSAYQYKNPMPGNLYTVTGANSSNTYAGTSSPGQWRLFQPSARFADATGSPPPNYVDRVRSGNFNVGRSQTLPTQNDPSSDLGTNVSTFFMNTASQVLRYRATMFTDSADGINQLHARAKSTDAFSSFTDVNLQAVTDGMFTLSVNAPAATDDQLDQEFGLDVLLKDTGKVLPVVFSIDNPSITDGMRIHYAGGGGWKFRNHGASVAGDAPTADSITNPWYDDEVLQTYISEYDINIVYVYIANSESQSNEEAGMSNILTRLQNAATAAGVTMPKVVFVSSHPLADSVAGSGAARAAYIAKQAGALGCSFIDLYTAAADDGKTEATVRSLGYHPVGDQTHFTDTGAMYYANKIWDIITGVAT